MKKVVRAARRGRSFTVVRNATPVFRIEPIEQPPYGVLGESLDQTRKKNHTLADFDKIR
ncbi:MAG: hypothetical protein Q8R39_02650 [bacterium]|nr:hypothetical protein [bacterium]MDZ4284888.1 hypothetical protein [Patescibacteria group bacterium]